MPRLTKREKELYVAGCRKGARNSQRSRKQKTRYGY